VGQLKKQTQDTDDQVSSTQASIECEMRSAARNNAEDPTATRLTLARAPTKSCATILGEDKSRDWRRWQRLLVQRRPAERLEATTRADVEWTKRSSDDTRVVVNIPRFAWIFFRMDRS
jgi:hypothetical protein